MDRFFPRWLARPWALRHLRARCFSVRLDCIAIWPRPGRFNTSDTGTGGHYPQLPTRPSPRASPLSARGSWRPSEAQRSLLLTWKARMDARSAESATTVSVTPMEAMSLLQLLKGMPKARSVPGLAAFVGALRAIITGGSAGSWFPKESTRGVISLQAFWGCVRHHGAAISRR